MPTSSCADILERHRDDLLRRWEARVRADLRVPEARRLDRPALVDDMPAFVAALIELLREARSPSAHFPAVRHAQARAREGYSAGAAVREWAHFRDAVTELLVEQHADLNESARVIHACIDDAVVAAVDAIEEQEQKAAAALAAVIEHIPEAVLIGEPGGIISGANRVALELLGYDSVDDVKRGLRSLSEELQVRDAATGARLEGDGLGLSLALCGERVVRDVLVRHRRTGRDLVLHSATAPVRVGGRVVAAVAVHLDVTADRDRARELAVQSEARERFMAVLAHDLRNPLAAVKMAASMVLEHAALDAFHHKAIARIERSADRMTQLIEDLLELTRIRQGMVSLKRADCDLAEIARAAVDELSPPARSGSGSAREPAVIVDVRTGSDGAVRGRWDRGRVLQVVSNLVKNALQHGKPGAPVRVLVEDDAELARLTVHNETEHALASADLARLFEPFTHVAAGAGAGRPAPGAQSTGGLGLGLSIVKGVVEAHGGRVQARADAAAGGVAFIVELPRDAARTTDAHERSAPGPSADPSVDVHDLRTQPAG